MANNLTTNNTSLQELLATINELPDEKKLQATKTVTPTTSTQTVSPDSGYDGLSSVTVNAMPTATQATPSISVSTAGKITATSTQSAGYVAAGNKTATKQLTTKAATTITPTKSSQTAVEKNVYTTGVITVAAIPSQYEDITTPLADLNTANGGTSATTMATAVDNTETLVNDEAALLEQAIAALEGKAAGGGNVETCTVLLGKAADVYHFNNIYEVAYIGVNEEGKPIYKHEQVVNNSATLLCVVNSFVAIRAAKSYSGGWSVFGARQLFSAGGTGSSTNYNITIYCITSLANEEAKICMSDAGGGGN